MNKLAFLFLAWSISTVASAQFQMSYSAADEDLEALYQNIKTYNPGLYIYNPDFDREAQKIMNELPAGEVSSFAYFTLVSKMCAASNEGHFGLGDWQDTIHSGFLNNTYRYMPLSVAIVDNRLFIRKDYSTLHAFLPGDEIITINGQPAQLIIDQLRAVTCTDGRIQTYGDRLIESGFAWKHFLYIEQAEQFLIVIRNRDGILQEHPIEAIFREHQVENYKVYYDSDQKPEVDESFADFEIKDHYAVLTLPSFDWSHIEKHNVKSSKFYKGIFKQLRENGTPNLIIDLRDNTGGRKEFAEDMVPHILTDDQGHAYLYQSTSWEGKNRTTKLPKAKKPYQGRIYVLVNGQDIFIGQHVDALLERIRQRGDYWRRNRLAL